MRTMIFLFGFLWGTSWAVCYVVDSGGSGDYTTIQAAADVVKPGDTVVVKKGTYNERVLIARPGGASNPKIFFISQPRRTATVLHGFSIQDAAVRIEGFRITHDSGGYGGGGIWIRSDNVAIVDNHFYDIPGQAVSPASNGDGMWNDIYVANNYMYRCNKGIIASGNNWLVENNEIERLVYAKEDADYTRFFGSNITFRGNYFHGTLLSEVEPFPDASHTDGFQTFGSGGGARNVLIENNRIFDGRQGVMARRDITNPEIRAIIIRNNVFGRLWAWGVNGSDNVKDVSVFNNVFYRTSSGVATRRNSSMTVHNNIFVKTPGNYSGDATSVLTGGFNLIDDPDPGYKHPDDILGADPLFADTSSENFRILPGSPAMNRGKDLSAYFTKDIIGVSRPQGSGWDIGAYEYVATGALNPKIDIQNAQRIPPHSYSNPLRILACGSLPLARDTRLYDLFGMAVTARPLTTGMYLYRDRTFRGGSKIFVLR